MEMLLIRFTTALATRLGAALVSILVTILVANQLPIDEAGEFFIPHDHHTCWDAVHRGATKFNH